MAGSFKGLRDLRILWRGCIEKGPVGSFTFGNAGHWALRRLNLVLCRFLSQAVKTARNCDIRSLVRFVRQVT